MATKIEKMRQTNQLVIDRINKEMKKVNDPKIPFIKDFEWLKKNAENFMVNNYDDMDGFYSERGYLSICFTARSIIHASYRHWGTVFSFSRDDVINDNK